MFNKKMYKYHVLFFMFIVSVTFVYLQEKETTIQGVVTELDWDENDNVVAIAIEVSIESGEDEDGDIIEESEYYAVILDNKGKELLNLINETVEVTGIVKVDSENNKTIKVKKYKVIEE